VDKVYTREKEKFTKEKQVRNKGNTQKKSELERLSEMIFSRVCPRADPELHL